MKKTLFTLAALLALSACSSKNEVAEEAAPVAETPVAAVAPTPIEPHWSRPNTNIADSKRRDMFDACMRKDGYTWVE